MAETVMNLYDAKTALSKLVDRAASGEEIIIAKAGKPLAKLVRFGGHGKTRKPGAWKGRMRIAEDFDDPLPEELQASLEMRIRED
ncbi:type II toxin-antitoxin system Phd/YefM family antitoxin [Candidatus Fermentibacteria bacterium]|nr:type II toxin-antitoxin system Phd/YefM family antitoxin [Candidatus Fermentibacteria bacterium]